MKQYITYYYLLFMLLIMGAFASMAQNDYGNIILGLVAAAFAALFGRQTVAAFSAKTSASGEALELLSLALLAGILSMRVFYLHFPQVEVIYGLAGALLAAVQVRRLLSLWTLYAAKNKSLAYLVAAFRLSIILYIFSMMVVPFMAKLAEPLGEAAFALLLAFLVGGYIKRNLIINGEEQSAFRVVVQWKDHSLVLMVLFFLFTGYMGLTKTGLIPSMYSNDLPQAYFELMKENDRTNSKATASEFKKEYDRFVERHGK